MPQQDKPWIRGVNLGGFLVLERFITPYFFAITDCTLRGDFTYHPNQIDAPPDADRLVGDEDSDECQPVQPYPVDEWTLLRAFIDYSPSRPLSDSKELAQEYLRIHYEHFVTRDDISSLATLGHVTHVRVPLGHWIMGDIHDGEPWVTGGWEYFERLVGWCREEGIEVWPDVHTAPGSQNGFDNSGQLLAAPTCHGWDGDEADDDDDGEVVLSDNVKRSLKAVQDITKAIADANMTDIVTGFGILNEPFVDCDIRVLKEFDNQALAIARGNLGKEANVYIPDMFNSSAWNEGWWTDVEEHGDTFLDSHYYHVFAERPRHLSPRQHIAYTCQHNKKTTVACCYEDDAHTIPSQGISRIIGEWSASFDTLVVDKLDNVMKGIAANGTAPEFGRVIGEERRAFLRNFVEAQMVVYEAEDSGVSRGWFYWNFKMEGGAFAEWDFLRGLTEQWIPPIPDPHTASVDLYGTCYDIMFQTNDDMSIIHEFPDPTSLDLNNWQGGVIDDDVVVTHGQSLVVEGTAVGGKIGDHDGFGYFGLILFGVFAVVYVVCRKKKSRQSGYIEVQNLVV